MVQCEPRRAVALDEGRRLAVGERIGRVDGPERLDDHVARVAATEPGGGEDPVAHGVRRDALAHLDHRARHLAARHERQDRPELVEPLDDEPVDVVHAARADRDPHHSRPTGRRGLLLHDQLVDRGERLAGNDTHTDGR
jgi:hypothetical protein